MDDNKSPHNDQRTKWHKFFLWLVLAASWLFCAGWITLIPYLTHNFAAGPFWTYGSGICFWSYPIVIAWAVSGDISLLIRRLLIGAIPWFCFTAVVMFTA